MSLYVWLIVAGGIAIFYFVGFLPEIRRWRRRKKNTGGEYEKVKKTSANGTTKWKMFG